MNRVICYSCLMIFFIALNLPLFGQVLERYELKPLKSPKKIFGQMAISETYLDLKVFPKAELRVSLPNGTSFFVADKPWFFAERDTTLKVSLVELSSYFSDLKSDTVRLAFLNPVGALDQVKVSKGYFEQDENTAGIRLLGNGDKRDKLNLVDFFVIAALLTFTVLAVFRTVNRSVLSSMLKPSKLFESEEETDTGFLSRVFSASMVFYILAFSMALALIGLVLTIWAHPLGAKVGTDDHTLFFFWLCGILICIGAAYLKFLWIRISAFIFDLEVVEVPQFMFMLRVISFITLLVFLILLVAMLNYSVALQAHIEVLISIMFFTYLTGVGLFLVVAQSRGSFKFYHLFSYICTSELIPFLVITKLLMG